MIYLIIFLSLILLFVVYSIAYVGAESERRMDEIMGRRKDENNT